MRALVTGATGFVGAAVVRELLKDGADIRVLVRAQSDRSNIDGLSVEPVIGDLRDADSLRDAVAGCDAVFHVAADYRLWTPRPEDMYESNVEGSRNLVRAAADAGVNRIVYTSSVAVLGIIPDGAPGDEDTPVTLDNMIGHYKRSKFLAEAAVRDLADAGAPVVIVNPSAPIGPRDVKPTPTGRMVIEAASGRMPAYVDTGLNLVHVEDVAVGHVLAHRHGKIGERYVLGGQNMMLAEILFEIATLAGRKPPRVKLPHGLVMPVAALVEGWARLTGGGEPFVTMDAVRMAKKRMFYSSAKAERDLGYTSRPPVDALREALTWFRARGMLG
ncbi:MAG: NAD-dependent epimerase/dehydratase family protein [Rhodospirillaceae bacterium]|nr:NAD-dependent epimerase/dehydratase family protein [Rhodospirillaceae bacterium]